MAEVETSKMPSLAEQYVLPNDTKTVEVPNIESPVDDVPVEVVKESDVVTEAADESTRATSTVPSEESVDTSAVTEEVAEETKVDEAEEVPEVTEVATEETNGTAVDENLGDLEEVAEETPEIKLETAPADFRFPTTNQTRHCFTRYVEYHRCVAAKGDDAPECDKFAKYYRSLCPGEWVDRWNEQRENGTFPGRL